jgi:predicted aminopeptidase
MAALGAGGLLAAVLVAGTTVCVTSGCSTLGYYAQSARGHLGVVAAARPVSEWLADPGTPPKLKERLALSQRMRDFAIAELAEPVNASYRRYADLHRSAAVWNVVAAPELSLVLKTWCFAVVGCVGYRGYYDEAAAAAEAEALRSQGLEVAVYPVPAYSTLGKLPGRWFADPLLNTFIDYPEADLARLVFHELAHQIAFAPGDTQFNESFATTVEAIGSERWLVAHASASVRAEHARVESRRADFRELTLRYRDRLQALYTGPGSDAAKREGKAALFAAMRAEHVALKASRWNGYAGYDGWFARADNAAIGVLAAYNQLVPDFERMFEREGRDFPRFYGEVRRLAALPMADRRRQLAAGPQPASAASTSSP